MHALKLEKHQKEEMVNKLRAYFLKERNEELGDLATQLLVDFMIQEFGDTFYNKGIEDAQRYISEYVDNIIDLQRY